MSFRAIKQWFDRLTNALFFQDSYDTKTVLDALGSVLVKTVSLRDLCHQSLHVVANAIRPRFMIIVIDEQANKHSFQVGRSSFKIEEIESLVAKTNPQPLCVTDEIEERSAELAAKLSLNSIAMTVRLRTTSLNIGYVVIGDKVNGSAFSDQDINLARIAADELSVAIQNSLRFEEIAQFNDRLQVEIAEATGKLRKTNRKLRALDEAKDEFISIASHQLRTPLTTVKGQLSMVLDGDAGKLSGPQQQLLRDTYESADRMAFLITDLLNVSRLKHGKLTVVLETVNLPSLLREEIEQLSAHIKSHELKVETHIDPEVPPAHIDAGKIRQVIMNFIDNAVFYSKSGGLIVITLKKDGSNIVLTVRDNGIGVPASEQPQIFSKFFRASNARYVRPDGTGIGLFSASKIIAAHHGSMIFESKENHGSTFGFRLPIQ